MPDGILILSNIKRKSAVLVATGPVIPERKHVKNEPILSKMRDAEFVILKRAQNDVYGNEICNLQHSVHVSKSNNLTKLSEVRQWSKCHWGRIKHADVADRAKDPIILPKNHGVSMMICQEHHCNANLGKEWVLSQVREKYWIVDACPMIKRIGRNCVVCKRLYSTP